MRELLGALLLALVLGGGGARAAPVGAVDSEEATEPVTPVPPPDETSSGYQEMPGHAETAMEGGLRVSVETGGLLRPARGYLPVQISLQNVGGAPRQVTLSAESHGSGRSGLTTRQVEVGARQRLVTWLPVPVTVGAGVVRVESPGLSFRAFSFYAVEPTGIPVLVLGTEQVFQAGTQLPRESKKPLLSVRFVPLEDAPRELAAYVGAGSIVVAGDPTTLSAEAWSALETYAATGGLLVLLKPPRDVLRRLPLLEESKEGGPRPYGFGLVRLCEDAHACGAALLQDLGAAVTGGTRQAVVNPAGDTPRWRGGGLSDGAQPLLPGVRAPVGRFMLLITLFVLAVGPGGLVLARRKGPLALLVVVPSVALITCLGIVAWSVFAEGFAVHAARYSFILLDRARNRALVAGIGAYYANLEPREFQGPVLGALLSPESGWGGQVLDADWSQGMRVTGGFLPSRTYREWGEVAAVPTRARLVVRREGSGYRVQNALGAALERGCVRLGGALWSLPELADGAEGSLTPTEKGTTEEMAINAPFDGFGRFGSEVWKTLQRPLPEGDFLARLGGGGLGPAMTLPVELERGAHIMRGKVDAP